ncbi:MAG: AAA-like domain-containing protein, partial [Prochlorotrichaceae cyanobacterium]
SLADTQKTYAQIAQEVRYSETYIKQLVAPKLWQLLSSILAEKVNKTNCRSLLEYKLRSSPELVPTLPVGLESPEGQVPLSSALYVERDSIEQSTYAEILQAGAFIRIKGPRRMGKTSLMVRILDYATKQNYATVRLNLRSGGSPVLRSIDKFLRWFCVFISKKLGIPSQLDDYWDEDIGPLVSSTLYFEDYLLNQIDRPLVLALDELNQIFEYPAVAKDFLALLRSWHEETKDVSSWQKLRFVLIHSTDIYIPLETYQSPFNVGLAIELPLLTSSQVEQLAKLQGLDLKKNLLMRLMQVSSGFPYLVRFALYHSLRHQIELSVILDEALEDGGIYKNYLRAQWQKLQREP